MNNNQTEPSAPKKDDRPQRHGWAPGKYFGTCPTCAEDFIGDKRATMCADCAYGIMGTIEEHPPKGLVQPPNPSPDQPVQEVDLERVRELMARATTGPQGIYPWRDGIWHISGTHGTILFLQHLALEAPAILSRIAALCKQRDDINLLYVAAMDRLATTQADLLQREGEIVRLREALQKVWDDGEMGWLTIDGSSIVECGQCGCSALSRELVKHDSGCIQGVVFAALTPSPGAVEQSPWSLPLPNEQGLWWWLSDDESIPCPIHIAYSGCGGDYFATIGQYGWTEPQKVADMGGWWMRLYEPKFDPSALPAPSENGGGKCSSCGDVVSGGYKDLCSRCAHEWESTTIDGEEGEP